MQLVVTNVVVDLSVMESTKFIAAVKIFKILWYTYFKEHYSWRENVSYLQCGEDFYEPAPFLSAINI